MVSYNLVESMPTKLPLKPQEASGRHALQAEKIRRPGFCSMTAGVFIRREAARWR